MTDITRIQGIPAPRQTLRSHLRLVAGLLFAAGFLYWMTGLWFLAAGLLALALLLSLLYAMHPPSYSASTRATHRLSLILAAVLTGLISLVAYFLILSPAALIARATGRDPLLLRKQPADSAWHDSARIAYDEDYYKAQY